MYAWVQIMSAWSWSFFPVLNDNSLNGTSNKSEAISSNDLGCWGEMLDYTFCSKMTLRLHWLSVIDTAIPSWIEVLWEHTLSETFTTLCLVFKSLWAVTKILVFVICDPAQKWHVSFPVKFMVVCVIVSWGQFDVDCLVPCPTWYWYFLCFKFLVTSLE